MFDDEKGFIRYLTSMGILILMIVVCISLFVTYVVPFLAAM